MVLALISQSYSLLGGRLLTRYSPVRHYPSLAGRTVRLACIRHAASVYPEPGSNSPKKLTSFEPSFRYPVVKVLNTSNEAYK